MSGSMTECKSMLTRMGYTANCEKTVSHVFESYPHHNLIQACKVRKTPALQVNVLILSTAILLIRKSVI